jgi:chromosome segregation ATPase
MSEEEVARKPAWFLKRSQLGNSTSNGNLKSLIASSHSVDSGTSFFDEEQEEAQNIPEMTEEEEEGIYPTKPRDESPPRRNLLQRIASIRHIGPGEADNNASSLNSSSSRLQASYDALEKEYCELKFEQTELVALADQRKLQKTKSAELMESLEAEIRQRKEEIAQYRDHQDELERELEKHPGRRSAHQNTENALNALLCQRDLEKLRLQEAKDDLEKLRKFSDQELLPLLIHPPTVGDPEVEKELARQERQLRVTNLERQVHELKTEIKKLKVSTHSDHLGKEIVLDDDSTKDTVSAASTFQSKGSASKGSASLTRLDK